MTYESARWETIQFVLAVVTDTWVQELCDTDTIYTKVASKDLLSHLQAGCTGRHALDLLPLHNKMQCYHLEVEGIPEYIHMLKDAQSKAGQEGRTIADETLLLFTTTAMLTTEIFPRANEDWEDHAEREKKWPQWKQAYKKARHALDLLPLHNKMQRYHLEVEGIPEYIHMLKDAQSKAGQEGRTISDETLLLFATAKMLTTEIFPRANDD